MIEIVMGDGNTMKFNVPLGCQTHKILWDGKPKPKQKDLSPCPLCKAQKT